MGNCSKIIETNNDLVLRESATFAWIPTITSVSRQAIFSGKPPIYFPSSINSTNSEEKLWKQFWQNHNISKLDVAYKRSLGDGDAESVMDSLIDPSRTKVVGLVIDKVDKIMHGMQLGASGMHNQIDQWCRSEYLISLLKYLGTHEYKIWITSDHGNIESVSKGRPSEGVIAESRGEEFGYIQHLNYVHKSLQNLLFLVSGSLLDFLKIIFAFNNWERCICE